MYLIDTRKYDDSFLLAKILEKVDITDEEKKKLFKHFEKPEVVDAVPVVRCKDCKYRIEDKDAVRYTCGLHLVVNLNDNDFCSRAERRKDAEIS